MMSHVNLYRETILRLVADLKKHEEQSVDSTQLQKVQ